MGKRPGQGDSTARGSAYMHVRVQVRRWPALDPVPGAVFRVRYCPGEIPAMVILEIGNPADAWANASKSLAESSGNIPQVAVMP
jgi:hypothetical protein